MEIWLNLKVYIKKVMKASRFEKNPKLISIVRSKGMLELLFCEK